MNPPKDPILAAILSVLMPGLGQFYCQQWMRGVLFLAGAFLLTVFAGPLGLIVWAWGTFDAYRIAKTMQGGTYTSEGPLIEMSKLRFPKINISQTLAFIGIPLGVVALLALVATVVVFRSGWWKTGGTEKTVQKLIERIEKYKAQSSSYPDSLEALIDPSDPIEKKQILDRWGNVYIYRPTAKGFDLISAGKDGRAGTADDVRHR